MVTKYRRLWYKVQIIKGYANCHFISARSKKNVVTWFREQGKRGLIQVATSDDLQRALRGTCLSVGKSSMEAPNSWLVRLGTEIIMFIILD